MENSMNPRLQSLAKKYLTMKEAYENSCKRVVGITLPEERVTADLVHVTVRKAYYAAEEEYNAALDQEVERLASEHTTHGIAAE